MYKRIFLLLLVSIFTVLIAVACSNQDEDNEVQSDDEKTSQTEETEEAEQSSSNQDKESETDSNDTETTNEESNKLNESESDNDNNLPEPIQINDKVQTDTGLIFEMEKITFENDHIAVHFNADNQSGFYKTLASQGRAEDNNLGGVTLQDDTGFDYRYVADSEEARIKLKDQEKVDGIIRFSGTIQNDAKTLTLKFNPEEDTDSVPNFTYEDIEIKWQ